MAAVFPPERVSPARERKSSGFALVLLRYRLYHRAAVQLYLSALQQYVLLVCDRVQPEHNRLHTDIYDLATASFVGAAQAISCG